MPRAGTRGKHGITRGHLPNTHLFVHCMLLEADGLEYLRFRSEEVLRQRTCFLKKTVVAVL